MKKHFNKRSESINKRLMESWGYTKKVTEGSFNPVLSYKAGYNDYHRSKTDAGDVVKTDAAAVVAGMVKVLEDGEPGTQADAEELLNKLPMPSKAPGGGDDLRQRFDAGKTKAIEQLFPNEENSTAWQ